MVHGNHGLELECHSVAIVSTLQGTRTSSKLFRAEYLVSPGERKSRRRTTRQSKSGRSFGVATMFKYRPYTMSKQLPTPWVAHRKVSWPEHLGHYAERAHLVPCWLSRPAPSHPGHKEEGLECSHEDLQRCRHSVMMMIEGQECKVSSP